MKNYQITQWCARFIKEQVSPGDLCIDATMGNGNDTLLLSTLCSEGAPDNYTLLLESHTQMKTHAQENSVSCITFNLGYLPGGDHAKATKGDTSIEALTQGLSLLRKGGLISLCIYSGGDSGFEERDAVLAWLASLDPHKYLVIRSDYYNRPNNPPIPVLIIKL